MLQQNYTNLHAGQSCFGSGLQTSCTMLVNSQQYKLDINVICWFPLNQHYGITLFLTLVQSYTDGLTLVRLCICFSQQINEQQQCYITLYKVTLCCIQELRAHIPHQHQVHSTPINFKAILQYRTEVRTGISLESTFYFIFKLRFTYSVYESIMRLFFFASEEIF